MKRSIGRILLTFLMMVIALSVNAQSKPKRDTSKDRSAVVAKKQKENSTLVKSKTMPIIVAKQTKQKVSRRRKHVNTRITSASYLTVNQSVLLSKVLKAEGGNIAFDVSTDGKEYTIVSLPSWCKVSKYSNCFLLEYAANPSNNERRDWFVVKSDSKEVRVNLTQPAKPCEFMAYISSAYLKHNVYSSAMGCLCLEIHATVTIAGAAGENCSVDAYFLDKQKRYVKASLGYSSYALSSSNPIICVSAKVTPSANTSRSYDVVWYLPNNALDLQKKKNELCCEVMFWRFGNGYVSNITYPIYFKAKSKRGVVTTESY